MARFKFIETKLSGLMLVQRMVMEDRRGFLSRFYCAEEFSNAGIKESVAQINHTLTREKGTVRGLHFQYPPHAETKFVSCIKGEIWDVAVDLRKDSPTFLQWHGEVLSEDNRKSLLIPEGFAHGFQALTNNCELIYLHTSSYCSEAEGALNIEDPALQITWPRPVGKVSERDRSHPFIEDNYQGIEI